jgi:DMSO/TMAO reductase YedYZ molybdopterin-dependent catalytic subunit
MHMFNFLRRRRAASEGLPEEALADPVQTVDPDGILRVENVDVQRAQRIPPGQTKAKKWPVLHYGDVPRVDRATWKLDVWGAVENRLTLDWDAVAELPRIRVHADMHCVTTWSRLDQVWEGPSLHALFARAGLRPEARFLVAYGADAVGPGDTYTTNMPLEYALSPDALLATHCNGEPLTPDHGGPIRLVVPLLYAWKSAKWVRGLEVLEDDRPGFWERNGYHDRGDPWREERYG